MSLSHRPATRAVRRLLATTTASAMVIALGPLVGPAAAQAPTPRGIDTVCPPPGQEQLPNAFTDDEGSVHERSINCAAAYDIALGKTPQLYFPLERTKRDQMASFIARLIRTAGGNLPASPPDAFTDDEQSVHEANINALAAANVVLGVTSTQYNPDAPVKRDQMASFMARAADFMDDGQINDSLPPDTTNDFFTDDEQSVHEENINELAEQGIVAGRGNNQYDPDDFVDRAAMATFLMQTADFLAARGLWAPLAQVTVTGVPNQVRQGEQITATVAVPQGETIASVRILGCGVDETVTSDEAAGTTGFQVVFTIPTTQAAGDCTLRFIVTTGDGDVLEERVTVTVQAVQVQSVTDRPELIAAQVTAVDTTGSDAGVTVQYTFDEEITGKVPTASLFNVYKNDVGAETQLTGGDATIGFEGNTAEVGADNNTVLVEFFSNDLNSQAEADQLTLAAVAFGAVEDAEGDENPIGDAPLGGAGEQVLPAGITKAPDLTQIDNFDDITPGTEVDYTFDESADVIDVTKFRLVEVDGDVLTATALATGEDGQDETTITVVFVEDVSATTIARGFVLQSAVDESTGTGVAGPTDGLDNVLQAVDLAGSTDEPDLVSAEFFPRDTRDDQVIYTFDESVVCDDIGGTTDTDTNCDRPNRFLVYDVDADTTTATSAERNTSTTVIATFPDGTLDDAVGASVENDALIDLEGQFNDPDEVGVENRTAAVQAGRTESSDLIKVTVEREETAAGTLLGVTVIYEFDEDLTPASVAAADPFFVLDADGTRYAAASCTIGDTDRTVECDVFTELPAAVAAAPEDVQDVVLGTVEEGAVTDDDGVPNPFGAEVTTITTVR